MRKQLLIVVFPPPTHPVIPKPHVLNCLETNWLERRHLNEIGRMGKDKEKRVFAKLTSIIGLRGN